MKYYELTAYTGYCGEELTGYVAIEDGDEDTLTRHCDDLAYEVAGEWKEEHICDWKEDGYSSREEAEEDYYAGCGCSATEITKEEYEKETAYV